MSSANKRDKPQPQLINMNDPAYNSGLKVPSPQPGYEVLAPKLVRQTYDGYLKQVELAQKNAELAKTNPISGLPNKRAWMETIEHHRHSRHPLAMIIIDLDGLKEINDTHGHENGDKSIAAAGTLISSTVRPGDDFVAHWGGDEFAILVDASNGNPQEIIDKIVERLHEQFNHYNDHNQIKLKFSHGSAVSMTDKDHTSHNLEELFKNADAAMYAHKGSKPGRASRQS